MGLRSAVADHAPVIGPGPLEGLWLACGHYRNGVLLAPATAAHLATWICEGRAPDALRAFDPARLASATTETTP